jgi:hypothetical protein
MSLDIIHRSLFHLNTTFRRLDSLFVFWWNLLSWTRWKEPVSLRFEVFTAVIMKNVVFWDIKPGSYLTGDILRLRYRVQPDNAM